MGEMNPTGNDDLPREGAPGPLSDSECEQLLAGHQVPGSDVGALFRLIDATDPGEPLPGEAAAMAAFRDFHSGSGVAHRRFTTRVATVALAGSMMLAGGVAAAATGHLDSVEHVLGVHPHSHQTHGPVTTPTPTPPPASSPDVTQTPPAGSKQQGKAHQGNGKGKGVGETAHPSHPAHPSQAATPSHPSHPAHPATPTPTVGRTHRHTPTPAATKSHTHTRRHSSSPNPNSTKRPRPNITRSRSHVG